MLETIATTIRDLALVPVSAQSIDTVAGSAAVKFAELLGKERGMEPQDALTLARAECTRERAEMTKHPYSGIYAIVLKGAGKVGHVWIAQRDTPVPLTFHILYIDIDPAYRRRGFAEAAMQGILDEARRRGAGAVTLNVAFSNIAALALYEKLGFERFSRGLIKPIKS
jgi:ribosomal protein S18 acetylase RimI-like enzyme